MSGRLLGQGVLALLAMVLGLTVTEQARLEAALHSTLAYRRYVAMASLLRAAQARTGALEAEAAALRAALRRGRPAPLPVLSPSLLGQAGLLPVAGTGVRVTLADRPGPIPRGTNPNAYVVHQNDVLAVIDALAGAGARALAVGGQRLMPWTGVECMGPVIRVGGAQYGQPFVITAVGPARAMRAALLGPEGPLTLLRLYGLRVGVQEGTVHVPAYQGPIPSALAPSPREG